jgi:hypothetical protein
MDGEVVCVSSQQHWDAVESAGQMRWLRKGHVRVLQQAWNVTSYSGSFPEQHQVEWRDVPEITE